MKKNILVFPCGSEIALEIHRSVRYSTHFNLIGASSVNDHGRFVYENYCGNLPMLDEPGFIEKLQGLVVKYHIDAVYPAMDQVAAVLKEREEFLGCPVIASPAATTAICASKSRTYEKLKNVIKVPRTYTPENVDNYPVFVKPDVGYGSRGAKKILNEAALKEHLATLKTAVICQYLEGPEYTIDCFTNKNGELLFSAPRERRRIMNGISVNTIPAADNGEFATMARDINQALNLRGAWFFQAKRDHQQQLTLLEVASRLGGSSALFRAQGVNFALMSLFDAFDIPLSILHNNYGVEMDRALDNRFKLALTYNEVFVDFDDCLYLNKQALNLELLAFLYKCVNQRIPIKLLTRHPDGAEHLQKLLTELRINSLFDEIILLPKGVAKSSVIHNNKAIFIDDSFAERADVSRNCQIPVFSPDMVSALL